MAYPQQDSPIGEILNALFPAPGRSVIPKMVRVALGQAAMAKGRARPIGRSSGHRARALAAAAVQCDHGRDRIRIFAGVEHPVQRHIVVLTCVGFHFYE
jgi:hypothetical protein